MSLTILSKTYSKLPFCQEEILRYAGCKDANEELLAILKECLKATEEKLAYRVCYCELPVKTKGNTCDLGIFTVDSEKLANNLKGCNKTIVFAATIGIEIDRLIAKYGRISPSKALIFQAIGAAQIESLCDEFCSDVKKEYNLVLKPRFSPGYGDLPFSVQRQIFSVLEPERKIGLTLNSSMLMSPTKSVTAFLGLVGD